MQSCQKALTRSAFRVHHRIVETTIDDLIRFSRRKAHADQYPVHRMRTDSSHYASGAHARQNRYSTRRAYVKISYREGADHDANRRAHERYLEREGAGRNGERAQAFTDPGRGIPNQTRDGEERYFRMILSPEDGDQLDLEGYTRRVMAGVSDRVGQRVDWYAYAHYNTDRPHVHVIIRGDSLPGQRLDPRLIQTGIRQIAEREAERELGVRTQEEIERSKQRAIERMGVTRIDHELLQAAELDPEDKERILLEPTTQRQVDRLNYLQSMGLVTAHDHGVWSAPESLGRDMAYMQHEQSLRRMLREAGVDEATAGEMTIYHLTEKSREQGGQVIAHAVDDGLPSRDDVPYTFIKTDDNVIYWTDQRDAFAVPKGDRLLIDGDRVIRTTESEYRQRRDDLLRARRIDLSVGESEVGVSDHIRHMEREGAGRDGERARAFTDPSRGIPNETRDGEQRAIRLTLAPEDGDRLDLEGYTRRVMAGVSDRVGQRVDWYAYEHHDTDRPHVHVVIRGDSLPGQQLDPGLIQTGIRGIAEREAERELGPRSREEIAAAKRRTTERVGVTALDHNMIERAKTDPKYADRIVLTPDTTRHTERLEYLKRIDRVTQSSDGTWLAEPSIGRDLAYAQHQRELKQMLKATGAGTETVEKKMYHLTTKARSQSGTVIGHAINDTDANKDITLYTFVETEKVVYWTDQQSAYDMVPGDTVAIKDAEITRSRTTRPHQQHSVTHGLERPHHRGRSR